MGLVRRALTLWAFCSVGAIASAPIASAQDDTTRARALFEGAVAAIDEGRFADAVVDLRESLSLSPRAPTAFNLGIALGAWIGGLIVEGMGLAAAPYLGALIVAIGIALTRLSGRLDNAATPRRAVAAE